MSGLDPDAMTPVGRQPALRVYTPSNPNPWHGSIIGGREENSAIVGGERFTYEQTRTLEEMGIDPATVEVITVKRQATAKEWGNPDLGCLPDVFAFECPVLVRRADGKIKVISPIGNKNWVEATGWTSPPRKYPHRGFY